MFCAYLLHSSYAARATFAIASSRVASSAVESETKAAIAMFILCYLLTIILAPYSKKHGKNPGFAFVNGVTVAATGAAEAVMILGQQSLHDTPTVLIALVTLTALWKLGKKLPEPLIMVITAISGLVLAGAGLFSSLSAMLYSSQ